VTTLPTWAVWALSFGSPTLTFVGVLIGQHFTRRTAKELEKRSKREEAMRNLRWASELAVSDDEAKSQLGLAQLRALLDSGLLDEREKAFVDAALAVKVKEPLREIEQLGADVRVIVATDPVNSSEADIPSEARDEEGGQLDVGDEEGGVR